MEEETFVKSLNTFKKATEIVSIVDKVRVLYEGRLTTVQKEQLENHQKTFRIIQYQMELMVGIIEQGEGVLANHELSTKLNLVEFGILSETIARGVNFRMLQGLYDKQSQFLDDYANHVRLLLEADNPSADRLKYMTDSCHLDMIRIHSTVAMHPRAAEAPLDDLLVQDRNGERWKQLNRFIDYRKYGTKEELIEAFRLTRESMILVQAFAGKVGDLISNEPATKSLGNILKGGMRMVQYAFDKKRAERKVSKFHSNINLTVIKKMFELDSNFLMKGAFNLALPSIKQSELIYIPRHFPIIDREKILDWTKTQGFGLEQNSPKYEDNLGKIADLFEYSKELLIDPLDPAKRIPVRINSPFKLYMLHNRQTGIIGFFEEKPLPMPVEAIVLHIHGGGFVCQNTFLHQTYIRTWANNLGVPFFSIDYRKAPEHPYPCAIDDCYQTYMWLATYFDQVYGTLP